MINTSNDENFPGLKLFHKEISGSENEIIEVLGTELRPIFRVRNINLGRYLQNTLTNLELRKDDYMVIVRTGKAYVVVADCRLEEKTFGWWKGYWLEKGDELFIPKFCATGYFISENDTAITSIYSLIYGRIGFIAYNDSYFCIDWPRPINSQNYRLASEESILNLNATFFSQAIPECASQRTRATLDNAIIAPEKYKIELTKVRKRVKWTALYHYDPSAREPLENKLSEIVIKKSLIVIFDCSIEPDLLLTGVLNMISIFARIDVNLIIYFNSKSPPFLSTLEPMLETISSKRVAIILGSENFSYALILGLINLRLSGATIYDEEPQGNLKLQKVLY